MIRQITKLARSGALAIGVVVGLGAFTNDPFFGSTDARAGDRYERRDGFRCPTVGDCGRTGFRDREEYRPSFRSRDNDHRDWQRNHRRAYDERRYYDRGPNIYLDLAVPLYQYEEPVYVAPRAVYRGGLGAHTEWCFNRYRSYRIYDNTFQPYHGPRQRCYSPYS